MDKEIKIAGKKIFYRVYGIGKPVMLVHGFGETGDVWNNQASLNPSKGGTLAHTQNQIAENSLLEEKTRLSESQVSPPVGGGDLEGADKFMFIIPDLPGSGRSEMIDDMSMEGMAEVLKAILDTESSQIPPPTGGGGGASMIGHSMGGYITLAFVEKYEGLLRSFGLFHSSAFADTEEKITARRKGIEFIKEHGAFEFLKNATPNLFSQRSKDELPELIGQFVQSLNNFSPESLVSYYESMIKRPDRTQVLKNTRMPVLFIMGEHDNAVPLQDGLKLCHLPEKSYFHVLHQSGHMGMLEETEKSNRLLEEFLNEV
jgi:pimeloyl-ACP methyl ester carboxylesterase